MGWFSYSFAEAAPKITNPVLASSASGIASQSSSSASATPVKEAKNVEPVNYLKLPCPVKYEEIQKEVYIALKADTFEGFKFDFSRPLNPNFILTHRVYMGNQELPAPQQNATIKTPIGTYEFGATVAKEKWMLSGSVTNDGKFLSRALWSVSDNVLLRLQTQMASDSDLMSQIMADAEVKGGDWQASLKLGNNQFYGLQYIQSVSPTKSIGAEMFWLGAQRKSGVGLALRHQGANSTFVSQLATTGLVSLGYTHRFNDKSTYAAEFMYNANSRDASASIGYHYSLRQCDVRGSIDSNGCIKAFLEEKLNPGSKLVFSAELDHWKKDYKFGYGVVLGE